MKCPHCPDATLTMAERNGVEIDYCPKCRGVWLDRGELDKILDRAAAADAPPAAPSAPVPPQQHPQPQYYGKKPDDSHYGYPSPQGGYLPRKKKSWLSEIFD